MSYIGIKERKSDSLIDWSKVGSDISNVIIQDAKRRESEKKLIEDQSNELIQKARTEAPIGNADYVNKIVSDYSDQVQQRQLQLHRMLKNGMISQKDYTLFTNNLRTNTGELFGLFKEYQAEYDNKMDRYQKGISSISEVKAMALIEGFGNLSELVPVITEDGSAKLVRVGKDGKPLPGADNAVSVSQAKSRIKEKFDKYNLNDDIKGSIDQLGTVVIEKVKSAGRGGSALGFLEKITDPTVRLDEKGKEDRKSYLKVEDAIISEKLSSPYRVASVLFDYAKMSGSGKDYNMTTDPNLAAKDDSYILYTEKDGKILQPDFTTANGKKQIAQAEEFVRTKIRSGLSQKTELQAIQQPAPPQPSEWQSRLGKENERTDQVGNMIGWLYSGTSSQMDSAAKFFGALDENNKVDRTDEALIITRKNGQKLTLPFRDAAGNLIPKREFVLSVSSALLGEGVDVKRVVGASLKSGNNFQSGNASFEKTLPPAPPSSIQAITDKAKASTLNIAGLGTGSANQESILEELNPTLSAFGIRGETSGYLTGSEYITLFDKKGKKIVEVNLKSPSAKAAISNALIQSIPDIEKDTQSFINLKKALGISDNPAPID